MTDDNSQTIYTFLTRHQVKAPGASTIHENFRCFSLVTIEAIFDLQVKMILEDELDTFERTFLGSISVISIVLGQMTPALCTVCEAVLGYL